MNRLLAPALLLAGLAYPFAVYLDLQRVSVAWFTLPLAVLWLLRALSLPAVAQNASAWARAAPRLVPLGMLLFCLALALLDAHTDHDATPWLRAYPVLVNAMLLLVFGASLITGMPVIEQIARLRHPNLPPSGVCYTRKLTRIWCLFFATNGSVAAALALWGSWAWWTLYNGAISYALAGLLLVGEWWLRPPPEPAA